MLVVEALLTAAEPYVFQGDQVDAELASLNLTKEILQRTVEECAFAMANTTSHHPKTAGGSMAWFEGVRSSRDQLKPRGWVPKDYKNQGLVIEPNLGIVLNIAGGDRDTGRPDGSPATRSKKGPTMRDAVAFNASQLRLFNDQQVAANLVTIKDFGVLWLLLVFVDKKQGKVRSELSRPVGYEGNRPVFFDRRIILDPIDLDGGRRINLVAPPIAPSSPQIVVEIVRRGA